MKKNGKRYRELQKKRAIYEQQKKDKGPVIYKCWHERRNSCQLRSISDTKCQCTECKMIFPIEFYNYRCGYDGPVSQETLEASLRPVKYYFIKGMIAYLKPEDDPNYAEEQEEIDIIIQKMYVKDEATGKLVICKEAYDKVYVEVWKVIIKEYMPKKIRQIESEIMRKRGYRRRRRLKDYLD